MTMKKLTTLIIIVILALVVSFHASAQIQKRLDKPGFVISPDPFSGKIHIEFFQLNGEGLVEMFNIAGTRTAIQKFDIKEDSQTELFDIGSSPSGLYLIKLTRGSFIQTQRFELF